MFEHIPLLLALAAALFGVGWLVSTRRQAAKVRQPEDTGTVASDWTATGKIDFVSSDELKDDHEPALFSLSVQEYRMLESISGTRRVEVRWRKANLLEAKRVAASYNAAAQSGGEGEQKIAGLIEGPSIVPPAAAEHRVAPAGNGRGH